MTEKTIFQTIEELEMSEYFDELVEFANTKASTLEKAMIYFSIIETFAKILEIEFENKHRIDGQKIESGYKQFKGKMYKKKAENCLPNKLINKDYSNIASWDEIANKLEAYREYRNILAHNMFIDDKTRNIRSIKEINHIAYMASELAEEIYNLIIGAREYLEYEFEGHKKMPEHLL